MFGLMTVKRHDAIVAKADAVIDDAARHVGAEEFSAGRTLGQKVALAIKSLEEARSNAFRNRQMVLTLEAKVASLAAELAPLKAQQEQRRVNLAKGTAASAAKRAAAKAEAKKEAGDTYPDGLYEQDGVIGFDCRSCERFTEWDGELSDFEPNAPENVCGGSPRCIP